VETEWRGHATFRITRGAGWLRNLVANVGRLPRAGEAVPVRLRVVAEGDAEHWIRDFGGHRLESVQRAWNGLLVESFGAMTLGFRLTAEPPALRLEPAGAWLLGVQWPRALAPHGAAVEVGREDGCGVVVTAYAPLVGMVVRYEGMVVPD
jgi:hypothetical protein